MGTLIDCEKCTESKECDKKSETQREMFFTLAKDKKKGCADYEPRNYHGVDGVAA